MYRRRCLQAQLEGASLEQLARRAPQLLLADSVGSAGSGFSGAYGSISGHQLLDRVGRLVGEQLAQWNHSQGPQQAQQRPGSARSVPAAPERLAGVLLGMWTAAYTAGAGGPRPGGAGREAADPAAAAVAAHLLSIVHSQPLLHGPLLNRLAQVLLGEDDRGTAAGEAAQQQSQFTAKERLAAAVMLASTAGALVQPAAEQGQAGAGRRAPQAAGSCLAALRPLFVWCMPQAGGSPAGSCSSGAGGEPLEVPGPVWLQRLLEQLPLGSAAAMSRASKVAAAHLACLPHFRSHALLACGGSDGHAGLDDSAGMQRLLLCWRRPAQPPAGPAAYDGEFVGSLVFPACAAALRLQQWLLLRLGAAQALLGRLTPAEGGGCRAAKRQRLDGWGGQQGGGAGVVEEAGSLAEAVLLECSGSLQTALGASLAAAAGGPWGLCCEGLNGWAGGYIVAQGGLSMALHLDAMAGLEPLPAAPHAATQASSRCKASCAWRRPQRQPPAAAAATSCRQAPQTLPSGCAARCTSTHRHWQMQRRLAAAHRQPGTAAPRMQRPCRVLSSLSQRRARWAAARQPGGRSPAGAAARRRL